MRIGGKRQLGLWLRLVVLIGALAGLSTGSAFAAPIDDGEELVSFGEFGSGAGQLKMEGGGIVADPLSGHLFVSDFENNRISEFTAWGEFVKAWGWGVDTGASELQVCTKDSGCDAGLAGDNPGQMNLPNGIAIGPNGNLYVFERQNRRVQVFDQSGKFMLMFGGNVNSTDSSDTCTAADVTAGDTCKAGSEGIGSSEFSLGPLFATFFDYIDIGADGTVYVGDKDRIQVFEADGSFVKSLPLPELRNPWALDFDESSGDLYVSLAPKGFTFENTNAYRLDPATGSVVGSLLPTVMVEALATDPSGTVFASDAPLARNEVLLREISPIGELIGSCCETLHSLLLATNVVTEAGGVDLYVTHGQSVKEVSFVEVRGPAPDRWPPPPVPPTIDAQFASEINEASATLKAEINPNFWDDTTYFIEYGTAPCSSGECAETPVTDLDSGIVKKPITTDGVELTGLTPGTTYHYRFVAESGGGGPVYGIDPEGPEEATFADGIEGTFTTYAPSASPEEECANEAFRVGLSAKLWECRAYEMVSPVDKLGGDILVAGNAGGAPSRLDQSTPEGDKVTYSSYRSFGDAESAAYSTQYLATRNEGSGWSTHAISPPREGPVFTGPRGLDSQFKAFSEDLAFGWLVFDTSPLLAPGAVPDYPNLYKRDNTAETYQAMSTTKPTPTGASDFNFEVQGASADSTHTVFRANGKITATASNQSIYQVYENVNGTLRLVSVKPTVGGPITAQTTVGSYGGSANNGREVNAEHAVSDDGAKIYFTEVGGSGKLYVRVNGATTTQVSTGAATYWNATPDGEEALYSEEGALKLFDLATKTSTTLAAEGVGTVSKLGGVLGASENLTRVYFISIADLTGAAGGDGPNLYLYETGQPLRFIATLALEDARLAPAANSSLSPVSLSPRTRSSRVSPDGSVALFASRGALTGEDNLDQVAGEPASEVFRYDANSEELACLSCLGNGMRPNGRRLRLDNDFGDFFYASLIPGYEFLHRTRALSDDGDRAFFDSLNRLVPQDTNGKQDVYEWEAPGKGACEETSPNYRAASSGCINLITTGASPKDSEFIDASSDGRDVFFTTEESLVQQDPGQFDLYDAREGGGFTPPSPPKPQCEGEACLPQQTPAPPAPGAGQSGVPGEGNVPPPKKCPKGKVKKHGKCVKKHKKHHKRHKKHRAANKKGSN